MKGLFGMGGYRDTLSPSSSSADAARALTQAQNTEHRVKLLEENLAKALMICEALWELLSERTGATQEELQAKLRDVDLRDGKLDGKNQRAARDCPACGRTVGPRRTLCMYCGHQIASTPFQL